MVEFPPWHFESICVQLLHIWICINIYCQSSENSRVLNLFKMFKKKSFELDIEAFNMSVIVKVISTSVIKSSGYVNVFQCVHNKRIDVFHGSKLPLSCFSTELIIYCKFLGTLYLPTSFFPTIIKPLER